MAKLKVVGVVSKEGAAYLSHAAIILRGLGIPALNNINISDLQQYNGYEVIINSEESKLIINPDRAEVESLNYNKNKTKKYKKILKDF